LLLVLGAKEQKEQLWTDDKDRKARNIERTQRTGRKEADSPFFGQDGTHKVGCDFLYTWPTMPQQHNLLDFFIFIGKILGCYKTLDNKNKI